MANYLVAGAVGFIGAKVSELLLTEGHVVVGIDNMDGSYDIRLKHARLQRLQKTDGFEFHEVDISDEFSLLKITQGKQPFDAIINLAAVTSQTHGINRQKFIGTNITGTLNLLELCKNMGVKKFIQASTSGVYGSNVAVLPVPETVSSDYLSQLDAITQKSAESIAYSYYAKYSIDVTVFRYFNVFGPIGKPNDLIFKLCRSIYEEEPILVVGDGSQGHGFSYIDDVARGTLQGLKSLGYQEINLGGHELVSLNKLIGFIEKASGKKAKIEHSLQELSIATTEYPDLQKAKELLDWKPEISMEEGIEKTMNWYVSERDWTRLLDLFI